MLYKISYWKVKRETEFVLVDTTFSDACDIAQALKGKGQGSGHCVRVLTREDSETTGLQTDKGESRQCDSIELNVER